MRFRRSIALVALAASACTPTGRGTVSEAPSASQTPVPGTAVDIVVAATTDVHGRLRGWDYYDGAADPIRGLARAATIVDSVRSANPGRVVLVDAGDALQGNPLTYVAARVDSTGPHPVIAAMNAMHYDAMAVGNHDFNYGLLFLERAVASAQFGVLASNVYAPNGRRVFAPSRIVQRNGVRVAIVGATTPGAMIWDQVNLSGRAVVRDIVEDLKGSVSDVRKASDLVVVVMHSGLGGPSSYDEKATGVPPEDVAARVAREVPGVDLIVYGHSHREVADTVINGVMLMQPRNWATSVAVANVRLTRGTSGWQVASKRGVIVRSAGHAEQGAVVAATERAHHATLRYVGQTLGSTGVAWSSDSARVADVPLTDFILEVERRAAGADIASTPAFDLGARLAPGAITVAQVARLYPYDNTLRLVRIDGKQLRAYIEYSARYFRQFGSATAQQSVIEPGIPGYNYDILSGVEYTLDISRPVGQRLTSLRFKGRDVTDGDTFTLAVNNYRQSGGGGFEMLRGAPVLRDKQEEIRDLLIAEVKRRGAIAPSDYATRNWSLGPPAAAERAYRDMHATTFDAPGTTAARPARAARPSTTRLQSGRWVRIISTNDFHGALQPRTDANGRRSGGAAYVASAIAKARAECPRPTCTAIWLDGGDQFQGTPASNLAFGRPVVELFNRGGLAAAALGNHDFDWGIDTLRAIMRRARYAMLAANVTDAAGNKVPWIRSDTLIEQDGVKIGVIGVATVLTPKTTRPSNVATLRFVAPAPVVSERARALRARGADVVVVAAHAGAFCNRGEPCKGEIIDLADSLSERVDAIVSGHTHSYVATKEKGIPIVQGLYAGGAIGIIDIPLGGGGESAVEVRTIRSDSIAPDSAVASTVSRLAMHVDSIMGTPVATLAERMEKDLGGSLGNLIADAQRVTGGGDVAVMNTGGVRAPLPAGVVTRAMLFEAQPFGNSLLRIQMRGADLRDYLERLVARDRIDFFLSGVRVTYDSARAKGSRITSVTLSNGKALDPRSVYRLILLDFLASGGDGLAVTERALAVEDVKLSDLDALEQYLRKAPSPVRAPTDARLILGNK